MQPCNEGRHKLIAENLQPVSFFVGQPVQMKIESPLSLGDFINKLAKLIRSKAATAQQQWNHHAPGHLLLSLAGDCYRNTTIALGLNKRQDYMYYYSKFVAVKLLIDLLVGRLSV